MKVKTSLFISLFICTAIFGCNDEPKGPVVPPNVNPFADQHKYFPTANGNKWNYEVEIIDISGSKTLFDEIGIYSKDSQALNMYRDGKLWSYMSWSNVGSSLSCCGDRILLDYNLIDCTSDSVLLFSKDGSDPLIWIYQICDRFNTEGMSAYDTLDCLKTSQFNTFKDGTGLHIINYFGYKVGLIFRQESTTNIIGEVVNVKTRRLKSHSF